MIVRPSLDALAAFEAVARHLRFTAAAQELHVTQSAVSHRVKALEAALGVTLLWRSTREVTLTDDGAILAAAVTRGLAAIDEALAALEQRRRGPTVVVSCSPSFAIRWLVRRLPRFRASAPEVAVRIDAADRLEAPGRHGIDLCIRYGAGRYPGHEVTRLTHEEVFPVASPALLALRPLRKEVDLRQHVLLHHDVMGAHPSNIGWSEWLSSRARGVDADKGPRFSHAHMALEAALAGLGVALGRTTLVADDLAEGRLVAPLRRRVPSELRYSLLASARSATRPDVIAFRRWLVGALS